MTPTRTAPRTWSDEEFVTATLLNQQLRDNSEYIKNRPFANVVMAAIINTTSTSFTELTESRITLVCSGGNIEFDVCGIFSNNTAATTNSFDIAIDGTRYGDATVGFTQILTPNNGYADNLSMVHFTVSPPSVGSHTFSIYWKVSGGTGSILTRFSALEVR